MRRVTKPVGYFIYKNVLLSDPSSPERKSLQPQFVFLTQFSFIIDLHFVKIRLESKPRAAESRIASKLGVTRKRR
jgi:hypothetical protein